MKLPFVPLFEGGRFGVPQWFDADNTPMQVAEEIRNCTVFIGIPTQLGFSVAGTGFLMGVDQGDYSFCYLVTAAHLIWPGRASDKTGTVPEGKVHLRLNRLNGASPKLIGVENNQWRFHRDRRVDLCVLPMGALIEADDSEIDAASISLTGMALTPEKITQFGVCVGDEIFITGAFVGRVGERKNIPIVRIGNIAAMPEEPISFGSPRKPAYLIETRSLGGVSGSPVFVNLQTQRINAAPKSYDDPKGNNDATKWRAAKILPYFLLGMLLGSHSGQYAGDFISETDTDIFVPKDADFNAGISVVMLVADIAEFLESDDMAKPRIAAIEEHRKVTGYKPSGASVGQTVPSKKAEAESESDNSDHKEDFTRLLNAAAKTPPQDG